MRIAIRFFRGALPAGALRLALLLALASPAAAHTHHRAAARDTLSAIPRDSAPGMTADFAVPAQAADTANTPFVMPPMRKAFLEHPHNKLVHFPLSLAVVAAVFLVLGRRRPEFEVTGRWLVWLAAVGGIAAYFTGRIQKEAFAGEPKEWIVLLHEKWGLATAMVLVAWALLTLWKPARKHGWLFGIAAAALVLITGFYGGIVAHGE